MVALRIDMPINCETCRYYCVHEASCTMSGNRFISNEQKLQEWCPLIDVPKHLEQRIEEYHEPLGVVWKEKEGEA